MKPTKNREVEKVSICVMCGQPLSIDRCLQNANKSNREVKERKNWIATPEEIKKGKTVQWIGKIHLRIESPDIASGSLKRRRYDR